MSRKLQPPKTIVNASKTQAELNYPSLTVVVQNDNRIIKTNKSSETQNVTVKPVADAITDITPTAVKVSTPKVSPKTSLAKKVLVKNAMAQANKNENDMAPANKDASVNINEDIMESTIKTTITSTTSTTTIAAGTTVATPITKTTAPATTTIAITATTSATTNATPVQSASISSAPLAQVDQAPSNTSTPITSAPPAKDSNTATKPGPMTFDTFAKKPPQHQAAILANYVEKFKNHGYVLFYIQSK